MIINTDICVHGLIGLFYTKELDLIINNNTLINLRRGKKIAGSIFFIFFYENFFI